MIEVLDQASKRALSEHSQERPPFCMGGWMPQCQLTPSYSSMSLVTRMRLSVLIIGTGQQHKAYPVEVCTYEFAAPGTKEAATMMRMSMESSPSNKFDKLTILPKPKVSPVYMHV